jgi:hypothetical protein
MINYIKRIFDLVDGTYLARAYFFSFLMLLACTYMSWSVKHYDMLILFIPDFFLFPFAKLAYDQIKSFIFGDVIIMWDTLFFLIVKIIINLVLFVYAVFIAPVGIASIVIRLWLIDRNERSC